VSVFFALAAAFSNAASVVVQHIASTRSPPAAKGWWLVLYLFGSVLWWLGWLGLAAGFVFQAAALHNGLLSIVQTLLVTEIVFTLLIRTIWIHQSVRAAAWLAAAVTCTGVAVFVVIAEPRGGSATPNSKEWVACVALCGGATAVMTVLARWGSPVRRAALYATAAGTTWALVATFIKSATDNFTESGLVGLLTHWPVYALAAGGLAGVVLTQAALHVGPLSVSQPLMVIVDPVVSIVLGIALFREQFTHDPTAITVAVLAFAVMCLGVVVLTRTAPQTMEAAPAGAS
jgi:drug/metabolite transporter (DMT)-like permease